MRLAPLLAASAAIAFAAPAAARDLTIAALSVPEALPGIVQKALAGPFADGTGHPVAVVGYAGGLDAIRTQAALTADAAWDVVDVREADLQPGCEQNLFEKLDWSAVGGRDRMLAQGASECGIGAFLHGTVLTWDRDKFPATPSWSDFWDIAKYPGKRGLFHGARGNLEIALLADGVAPGDVYASLRSSDGVDRAFRKLDQLRPYVVWWTDRAQAIRILGIGDVLMTSAPNAGVAEADRTGQRNFAVQWAGSLYVVDSWAILKGSAHVTDAQAFLKYAVDPAQQPAVLRLIGYGGLARGADKLPPELASLSPSLPANLANAVHMDAAFWRDNAAKLEARFDDWLTH